MAEKIKGDNGSFIYVEGMRVKKIHPTAEELTKTNPEDFFYEVTVVGRDENRVEDVQNDVNVFTTGLVIEAPRNSHIEVLEHPQLYKAGYSLQGGVRLYNQATDGELLIPLFKFRDAEDLELPFRAALIVVRQTENTYTTYPGTERESLNDEENTQSHKKTSTKKKSGKSHMF